MRSTHEITKRSRGQIPGVASNGEGHHQYIHRALRWILDSPVSVMVRIVIQCIHSIIRWILYSSPHIGHHCGHHMMRLCSSLLWQCLAALHAMGEVLLVALLILNALLNLSTLLRVSPMEMANSKCPDKSRDGHSSRLCTHVLGSTTPCPPNSKARLWSLSLIMELLIKVCTKLQGCL